VGNVSIRHAKRAFDSEGEPLEVCLPWLCELQLEAIVPIDLCHLYPVCTGGKRAALPKDCGGTQHGHGRFWEAVLDRRRRMR
jgi:hypothetical protein